MMIKEKYFYLIPHKHVFQKASSKTHLPIYKTKPSCYLFSAGNRGEQKVATLIRQHDYIKIQQNGDREGSSFSSG